MTRRGSPIPKIHGNLFQEVEICAPLNLCQSLNFCFSQPSNCVSWSKIDVLPREKGDCNCSFWGLWKKDTLEIWNGGYLGKMSVWKGSWKVVSWLWIKVILWLRYLGASLKTRVFYVESWLTRMWPIHECDAISRTLALCCWILLWNIRKERAR